LCDPERKECVKSPPIGKAWYDTIPELIDEIEALECLTRQQSKEQIQLPADVVDLVSKAYALVHERDNNSTNCPGEGNEGSDGSDEESNSRLDGKIGKESSAPEQSKSGPTQPQLAPGFNIWWDSMCAQRLLNSSKERETVVDRLEDLIVSLDNANATALSYKTIVEGNDADNTMSEYKKESTRMKARYLDKLTGSLPWIPCQTRHGMIAAKATEMCKKVTSRREKQKVATQKQR
jgi:hypothetical protein